MSSLYFKSGIFLLVLPVETLPGSQPAVVPEPRVRAHKVHAFLIEFPEEWVIGWDLDG